MPNLFATLNPVDHHQSKNQESHNLFIPRVVAYLTLLLTLPLVPHHQYGIVMDLSWAVLLPFLPIIQAKRGVVRSSPYSFLFSSRGHLQMYAGSCNSHRISQKTIIRPSMNPPLPLMFFTSFPLVPIPCFRPGPGKTPLQPQG